MGFLRTFREFKGITQILIVLSFLIGIAVLVVAWKIDTGSLELTFGKTNVNSQWFHGHAYIPNIVAGFTGFLIGVPVALVILATFTVEREQSATLKRVNQMSKLAWNDFLTEFRAFSTSDRMKALTTTMVEANAEHNKALQAVRDFINYTDNLEDPDYVEYEEYVADTRTSTEIYTGIQACYEPFKAAVDPITAALGDRETIETQWSALSSAWQTLDQFVRLQRLEQRLEWFIPEDRSVYAEMRKLLSYSLNPLTAFPEIHGFQGNAPGAARTMVNTVNTVHNYGIWGEAELWRVLSQRNAEYFGYAFVPHYVTRAHEASEFLTRLDHCVQRIVDSKWPASATKPIRDEDP